MADFSEPEGLVIKVYQIDTPCQFHLPLARATQEAFVPSIYQITQRRQRHAV